jgi:hypothetical protein
VVPRSGPTAVQVVEAFYTDGVFRPVGLLQLADQQRVRLTIEVLEVGPALDRAAALHRLRTGIARMSFYSPASLPSRDERHRP